MLLANFKLPNEKPNIDTGGSLFLATKVNNCYVIMTKKCII